MKNKPLKGKDWQLGDGAIVVDVNRLRSAVEGLRKEINSFEGTGASVKTGCQKCGSYNYYWKGDKDKIRQVEQRACINCLIDKWLKCWDAEIGSSDGAEGDIGTGSIPERSGCDSPVQTTDSNFHIRVTKPQSWHDVGEGG